MSEVIPALHGVALLKIGGPALGPVDEFYVVFYDGQRLAGRFRSFRDAEKLFDAAVEKRQ